MLLCALNWVPKKSGHKAIKGNYRKDKRVVFSKLCREFFVYFVEFAWKLFSSTLIFCQNEFYDASHPSLPQLCTHVISITSIFHEIFALFRRRDAIKKCDTISVRWDRERGASTFLLGNIQDEGRKMSSEIHDNTTTLLLSRDTVNEWSEVRALKMFWMKYNRR